MKKRILLGLSLPLLFQFYTHADDSQSPLALPLSVSIGVGTLESSDLNLKSRNLNALSLEALLSYRVDNWLFGPHLDYRWQGQMTSIDSAGGTNLKGKGYLIGLGARHNFSEKLFAQGSVDFLGEYDLTQNTSDDEDDKLGSPMGLRFKAGYAFIDKIPNLTFDVDFQYLTFKKIHITDRDLGANSNQLVASIGLTYQFAAGKKQQDVTVPQTPPMQKIESPPVPEAKEELAKIEGIEKVGNALLLRMTGASFDSGSAKLKESAKEQFAKAAGTIAQSNSSVRIEGHTDDSGSLEENNVLSQARADSVKAYFIEKGVSADRITSQGFGPSKPVVENTTKDGRAKNRRVEVYLDPKGGEQNE